MANKAISAVVPCFNEEKTIQKNLRAIHEYLRDWFDEFELIVVNDGSTDGTLKEIESIQRELNLRVIDNDRNEGKGKAVRQGMLQSSHDVMMYIDADLGIPINELKKFAAEIENGSDLVIASRFVPGIRILKPVLWHRKFMEKVFRILRVIVINDWEIKDTQCGFKVFRRKAAMEIFPKLTVKRFAFDAEIVFIANKLKYKIKELPITLQNPPESHIDLIRDPLNMFFDLIRIRVNDWKGKYE